VKHVFNRCVPALGSLLLASYGFTGSSELTAETRRPLEANLRAQVGYGFSVFECDGEPPLGPGDRFSCNAVDEEGDRLRYTIEVDDQGGASVVSADQEAASLTPADLEMLAKPCRAFFESLVTRQWQQLFDALHPNLQAELGGVARVKSMLEPVLEFYGTFTSFEPTWLTVRFSGEQELQFMLQAPSKHAEARFGFARDDAGELRLLSFVVTAIPGSPEQALWLEQVARKALSKALDLEIVEVDAPLTRLVRQGDMVEGVAVLADGRKVAIAVEQRGHKDDFDVDDYHFAVLEIELLLERALRGKLEGLGSVRCESKTVPDGGQTTCTASLESGDTRRFTVLRQGGDHRVVAADDSTP